ncbi:MAG: hypothetical protein AUG49_02515 [Catenulispora sp. 13_1_20CM_3_70_7]|nr:MAG: hypothetical protein AUG49_02515 [Catenulispora sp. 13_1_20CM_3_70_7]
MNKNATPDSCNRRSRSNNRTILAPSSCAVGSSRMMNFAPNDSARAISSICRSSTARVEAGAVGSARMSYSASTSAVRAASCRQLIGRRPGPCRFRWRFSATDSEPMIVDFW